MASSDDIITADNLGRRRARMLPALAVIFLTQQTAFLSNPPAERAVDHVRIGAWVVLTAVILLTLTTGGWWFRSPAIRAALDDERTRAVIAALQLLIDGTCSSTLRSSSANLVATMKKMISTRMTSIIGVRLSVGSSCGCVRSGMRE